MNLSPLVDDLLAPVLQVAMPRSVGSPALLRRSVPPRGDGELFPSLRRFRQLETNRCPVIS